MAKGNPEFKNEKCKAFHQTLKNWRISHLVENQGYHFQVQIQHNFYPSKGIYWNSVSRKKFRYPKWKDVNEFLQFLGKNVR